MVGEQVLAAIEVALARDHARVYVKNERTPLVFQASTWLVGWQARVDPSAKVQTAFSKARCTSEVAEALDSEARRESTRQRRKQARQRGVRLGTVCSRWRDGRRLPELRMTGRWLEDPSSAGAFVSPVTIDAPHRRHQPSGAAAGLCGYPCMVMKELRGEVGTVGPDECMNVWIKPHLCEHLGVLERFEDGTIELAGEVNLPFGAIIESHPHDEVSDQLDIGNSDHHGYSNGSIRTRGSRRRARSQFTWSSSLWRSYHSRTCRRALRGNWPSTTPSRIVTVMPYSP